MNDEENIKENNKSEVVDSDIVGEQEMAYRKNRIQVLNPKTKRWVKIDTKKGKIVSVKSDNKPYKGIRRK